MRTALLLTASSLALGAFAHAQSTAPCYEPDLGVLIGSDDDVVFPALTLGTPFPAFGTAWQQVQVSTNGFVWLGGTSNPDSGCCAGTGASLASGAPRICALWADLVTDGVDGSGVYHKVMPGRDVITWRNTFESYDPTVRFTVQLQLVSTGEFTVWFHPLTQIVQPLHTAVCGASPGNVADPGSLDLSVAAPHNSGTQAILYEEWPVGTFDLAQKTFEFLPNGQGGWLLQDRTTCPFVAATWTPYGAGCPAAAGISGASFYELLSGGTLDWSNQEFELVPNGSIGYLVSSVANTFFNGYTTVVPMQDDQVVDQVLPFPFTHPGGICTTAGFCSNGFLWIDNFNNAAPAAPFVPAFLFDGPRIAAFWTDLDLTSGGAAYYDATPTVAYFTWVDAPDFYSPSLRSTFQVQLHSDGRIRLCYRTLALGANRPVLAGYGLGGAIHDPGSIDLTASVPFASGTGTLPVLLDWQNVPPVLGQSFPLQVHQLRPSALVGVLALGLTQFNPGIPLAAQGMPGCELYTSLDVMLGFPIASTPTSPIPPLAIPGTPAFVGAQIFAQAAILDFGLTPLGLLATNGGTLTLGFY